MFSGYSCNMITMMRIQISSLFNFVIFSSIRHQMMILLSPIVSGDDEKLALNTQLQTIQIVANDVQMLILCLSYFITTVHLLLLRHLFTYAFYLFKVNPFLIEVLLKSFCPILQNCLKKTLCKSKQFSI